MPNTIRSYVQTNLFTDDELQLYGASCSNNIYIRTTGSLIQLINLCWCSKNNQYYMLAISDYSNSSIDNYKREIFKTFMLGFCVFIKSL